MAPPALWIVDAGNTSIKIARFSGCECIDVRWTPRIGWDSLQHAVGELCVNLLETHGKAAGISISCARAGDRVPLESGLSYLQADSDPYFISSEAALPFAVNYAEGKPGADRLANACALRALSPGRAAMCVDFGTATHVEVTDHHGAFRGGMILPGVRVQFESLAPATGGRLPALGPEVAAEVTPLADSTASAIRSGIILSQAAFVERALTDTANLLGGPVRLYITGGGANLIKDHLTMPFEHEPNLTMLGLVEAWMHAESMGAENIT